MLVKISTVLITSPTAARGKGAACPGDGVRTAKLAFPKLLTVVEMAVENPAFSSFEAGQDAGW
jgi:hypothetical protein